MPTIFVDNKPYEVKEGQNLLRACLSLGFDLPYFCWHPALHSVGACRQCAVKLFRDEKDTRGRIVMSCMTAATDGTRISINDPEARKFRAGIIEWLMMNHPHDCPVCDEGGECHLQDMTVMTGHTRRRYRFKKRTHRDQDLGPFVSHSMNRCIQCYRCVRFYRDYTGGRDLDVFACHDHIYFGRQESGILESEFAGNLVEVCPTGVFTDKTLGQHYTRKWDLQTAPSICVHCGVGCNTIPGERYGLLRRIRNRYNGKVNGYFLCDRGRYGYMFVNDERRIRHPLLAAEKGSSLQPLSVDAAMDRIRDMVARAGGKVLGIGSARASLESNFALRSLVGADRFYAGMAPERMDLLALVVELLSGSTPSPSLAEVAHADAVFVLGENVSDTAPVMALTLRRAARNESMKVLESLEIPQWNASAVNVAIGGRKGAFFVVTSSATRLDDLARLSLQFSPEDQARLAFAVANSIAPDAPPVPGLSDEMKRAAQEIAAALREADNPLVVSGVAAGNATIIQAAFHVARALRRQGKPCSLTYVLPECNSMGLALFRPRNLRDLIEEMKSGDNTLLIILENDLYQHLDYASAERLLSSCRVVALDPLPSQTTRQADIVLPAATFAEGNGTLVNTGGFAQRYYRVFEPQGVVAESWVWAERIMDACGHPPGWNSFDGLQAALASQLPVFADVPSIAPPADYRIAGMRIARQPHRASGRTAIHANSTVHEPRPPQDNESPFSFSMEGYTAQPPSPLIPGFWAPGWNSPQSVNKFQEEVGGPLRGGDPGKQLLVPSEGTDITFAEDIPGPFRREDKKWLILPRYSVFGSDELSRWAPAVRERTPEPAIWLNPREFAPKGAEVQKIELSVGDFRALLPVRFDDSLPPGIAMVSSWLTGLPGETLPLWGLVRIVNEEGP